MCWVMMVAAVIVSSPGSAYSAADKVNPARKAKMTDEAYQKYLDYFEKVYKTMEENYYKPVNRADFDRFIDVFDKKIYKELADKGHSIDYIRWRSAAKLVDFLKDKEDIFSALYPPKPAKEYEKTALDKRIDLGIKGKLIDKGYEVTFIEPRSDAYEKGLREYDLIVKIGDKNVGGLKEDEINKLLEPIENSITTIDYFGAKDRSPHEIKVISKEYFKQSVFEIPTPVAGIYGLEIKHFNRKTGEDVFRFIDFFKKKGPLQGLIIDLRNNPGGPPLAARELASFFLPAGEEFTYFQRKGQPKTTLDVPAIPDGYKYDGPMVILINKDTGSASELFSGVMQKRKRAVLMGKNSAGQVFLKSMFTLDDDSMVLLVTARGHYPDGNVFPFSGLVPDRSISDKEEDSVLKYAVSYLMYMDRKSQNEPK